MVRPQLPISRLAGKLAHSTWMGSARNSLLVYLELARVIEPPPQHLHCHTDECVRGEVCDKNPIQTNSEMRTKNPNWTSQTGEERGNRVDGNLLGCSGEINSPSSSNE